MKRWMGSLDDDYVVFICTVHTYSTCKSWNAIQTKIHFINLVKKGRNASDRERLEKIAFCALFVYVTVCILHRYTVVLSFTLFSVFIVNWRTEAFLAFSLFQPSFTHLLEQGFYWHRLHTSLLFFLPRPSFQSNSSLSLPSLPFFLGRKHASPEGGNI